MHTLLAQLLSWIRKQLRIFGLSQLSLPRINLFWKLFSGYLSQFVSFRHERKQRTTYPGKTERGCNDKLEVVGVDRDDASVTVLVCASKQPQVQPFLLPTSVSETLHPSVSTSSLLSSRASSLSAAGSQSRSEYLNPGPVNPLPHTSRPASIISRKSYVIPHTSQVQQSELDRVSRPGSIISGRRQRVPGVDKSAGGIVVPIQAQRSLSSSIRSFRTQSSGEIEIEIESTSDIGPPYTNRSLRSVNEASGSSNVATARDQPLPSDEQTVVTHSISSQIFAVDTTYMTWVRYNSRPTVEKVPSVFKLSKMELEYNSEAHDLAGWKTFVHPEGDRYFFHPTHKIYTRTNLYDAELFYHIQCYADQLLAAMRSEPDMPDDVECVIQLDPAQDYSEEIIGQYTQAWDCLYYLVHHRQRVLFWVSECAPTNMRETIDGVTDPAHIKYVVEEHYWRHIELYPEPRPMDLSLVNECVDMIAHASYDNITSLCSTVPYNNDQLRQQLTLIKSFENSSNIGGYSMCVIGRMMNVFTHEKYINFVGQPCARLSRNQAVYAKEHRRRPPLINIFSLLLFSAPEAHLKGLESLWTDEVVWEAPWKAFVQKLQREWHEFILYSALLLVANAIVLTIPTVDNGFTSHRSPVQILCYTSSVCSLAAIFLGFLVSRQYRSNNRETALGALTHLKAHSNGLETLSIIYSLPHVGFMWGIITLFSALSCMFFVGTTWLSRATMLVVEVIVVSLIIWCLIVGRERYDEQWWLHQQITHLRQKWSSAMENLKVGRILRKPHSVEKPSAEAEVINTDQSGTV